MKKMKVGDYILTKDIPDQETLDRIRECVKKMGYAITDEFGSKFEQLIRYRFLHLSRKNKLQGVGFDIIDGKRYTPQEIFAMAEEPEMKKMKAGDYIPTKDIPDQETLDRIRECVRKMGYGVSKQYGRDLQMVTRNQFLLLDNEGDLVPTALLWCDGVHYTPQEIFAMAEGTDMKEDVKQTIERMKKKIAALEQQLMESEKKVTYERGDRFYINNRFYEEYILAQVDNRDGREYMCLVGLNGGNRWEPPIVVDNACAVSHEEMIAISVGCPFQLIEK